MRLILLDREYSPCGAVTSPFRFELRRRWNGQGGFSIECDHAAIDSAISGVLDPTDSDCARYVFESERGYFGRIDTVDTEVAGGGTSVVITGRPIESILDDRVCASDVIRDGQVLDEVRALLDEFASDGIGIFGGFDYSALAGGENWTGCCHGRRLGRIIFDALEPYGCSLSAAIDMKEKLIRLTAVRGRDRGYGGDRSFVITPRDGRITAAEASARMARAANYAVVRGAVTVNGEGSFESLETYAFPSAQKERVEIYIGAAGYENTSQDVDTYARLLRCLGRERLYSVQPECDLLLTLTDPASLGSDVALGDVCGVSPDARAAFGLEEGMRLRVAGTDEVCHKGRFTAHLMLRVLPE